MPSQTGCEYLKKGQQKSARLVCLFAEMLQNRTLANPHMLGKAVGYLF